MSFIMQGKKHLSVGLLPNWHQPSKEDTFCRLDGGKDHKIDQTITRKKDKHRFFIPY